MKDQVQKAVDGDAEALEMLFTSVQGSVYAVALGRVRDPDMAQDVAQEALTRGIKSIGSLKDQDRFEAWICGIARNVAADHLRKAGRQKTASLNEDPPAKDPSWPGRYEKLGEIFQALDKLNDSAREAVVLKHLEGKSYEEIADVLDTKTSTVRGLLYRAMKTLRSELVK